MPVDTTRWKSSTKKLPAPTHAPAGMFDINRFRHERDNALASKIISSDGAQAIIKSLHDKGLDRAYNYIYRSSCPELTAQSAPDLFSALDRACEMFGVSPTPKVFVTREYRDRVSVRGIGEPFIVFSSEYLRRLDGEMLLGVLAGQAAALRCQHHIIFYLTWGIDYASSVIPGGALVVEPRINDWKRGRYFTYDRAFCLATNDRALALKHVLLNVVPQPLLDQMRSGMSDDAFLEQAERFMSGMTKTQTGAKWVVGFMSEKDWLPERYAEINNFFLTVPDALTTIGGGKR